MSPKSENISWISWMCVFLGKRKQYENRNFFPVLTSIGLSGTLISLLMIASLFHPFFFFFGYMNLHYLARNLLLSRTGCIFHLANFWKSSLPSLCPYLIAFLHFSLVTSKSNYSILGAYYTEWSKPERKTPIQYTNAYIWNLERW